MDFLLSPEVVRGAGAVVVAALALQALMMLVATARRFAADRETRRLSLDILRLRTDTALAAFHQEKDAKEFAWNGTRKFEIDRKVPEIEGVHSFYLVPHDGKPLPPFLPGQYLTFQLKIPGEPKPVIRCYSLSDSPIQKKHYRVSIKKIPPPRDDPKGAPGLSSSFFNDVLHEGDIVDVKAPAGHFYLPPQRDLPPVLIGGGIGITPVASMLNTLCAEGHTGEVWFFLGVNNSSDHVMKADLEALARDHENLSLNICYSNPLESDVEGRDYQHAGYVSVDLFKKLLPSNNYAFYICGPPPMMESITTGLKEWGVPEKQINFEAFGKATVQKTPKPEAASAEAAAAGIEVSFARTGKTLKWTANDGSLLDFAEENGISMDFACRTGNCGTCITAVKDGEVEYLVAPGHQAEKGSCLACVSVPKGPLTLDA